MKRHARVCAMMLMMIGFLFSSCEQPYVLQVSIPEWAWGQYTATSTTDIYGNTNIFITDYNISIYQTLNGVRYNISLYDILNEEEDSISDIRQMRVKDDLYEITLYMKTGEQVSIHLMNSNEGKGAIALWIEEYSSGLTTTIEYYLLKPYTAQ